MTTTPTLAAAWNRIEALGRAPGAGAIRALFAADPDRARRMTVGLGDLRLDFSKTAISPDVLAALLTLAEAADLDGFRRRFFAGEAVNATEGRAALHMALRAPPDVPMRAGSEDATTLVHAELARMRGFVDAVHDGTLRGATGKPFRTVLNVGIGGSELGPLMATEALTMADGARLEARFLSNVDGLAFLRETRGLDPATTLVLIASKSFTTQETAANAAAVRGWITAALGEDAIGAHCAALSTNLAATAAFGIAPERVFGFRDWVGGRFSLWSPVGLVIALAAGWEAFARLHAGAHAMDVHFRDTDFAANLPVLLALIGIWHVNGRGVPVQAVLPYDDRLRRFPAFLQQLEMESNGKGVQRDGSPVTRQTNPVVFGEPGTNAQHSFMQMIHQGPMRVPVDIILSRTPSGDRAEAHAILAAHAIAQAEALLGGKTSAEAKAETLAAGADAARAAALAPHRSFTGDRPSVFITQEKLDAFGLGRLIALYEHKVAVQGHLWDVNSFDQWGVELGKVLAGGVLKELQGGPAGAHDASTAAQIAWFRGTAG